MIPRYTHPDMGAIWSDRRRYETWLEVELAAADAMADAGIVPVEAARDLRARAGFDVARIEEIEQTTQHDVIALRPRWPRKPVHPRDGCTSASRRRM